MNRHLYHKHSCTQCSTRFKCTRESPCARILPSVCAHCYSSIAFTQPSDELQDKAMEELDALRHSMALTMSRLPGSSIESARRTSTAHYLDGLWIVGWVK